MVAPCRRRGHRGDGRAGLDPDAHGVLPGTVIPGETQQGSGAPAPAFRAAKNTPKDINTLANAGLLTPNDPNSVQPARLSPMQAVTCSQDHNYGAEQKAYNRGLMDKFVQFTSKDECGTQYGSSGLTMDYDGNNRHRHAELRPETMP